MEESDQLIHGIVAYHNRATKFQFSAVYVLHTIHDRRGLWTKLREKDEQMEEAWLIMEDFNTILTNEDRVHGSEVQDDETANFRGFMDDCNLTEMPIIGRS